MRKSLGVVVLLLPLVLSSPQGKLLGGIGKIFGKIHGHIKDLQNGRNEAMSNSTAMILSSLYGYNDCIGGVNNFDTEQEYIEELKRRNCTVVKDTNGKEVSNVADSRQLSLACGKTIEWADGMPVTFNFPLVDTPDPEDIQVGLSDGSVVTPECVVLGPANENNELDTLLLLGQFGDGPNNTVYPETIFVVGEVMLQAEDGLVIAQGITYSNPGDMRYLTSSVRMVYARLWDVQDFQEGSRYPMWPLPSSVYPNNCESLFPNTRFILRVAFSGGVTLDGITSVTPLKSGIFNLRSSNADQDIPYLGLADLGKTVSVEDGEEYLQDSDNYIDICLESDEDLPQELILSLNCDESQGTALYPPKGSPYICAPEEVTLSTQAAFSYYKMAWQTENFGL